MAEDGRLVVWNLNTEDLEPELSPTSELVTWECSTKSVSAVFITFSPSNLNTFRLQGGNTWWQSAMARDDVPQIEPQLDHCKFYTRLFKLL